VKIHDPHDWPHEPKYLLKNALTFKNQTIILRKVSRLKWIAYYRVALRTERLMLLFGICGHYAMVGATIHVKGRATQHVYEMGTFFNNLIATEG
jgi:hypothetical protein